MTQQEYYVVPITHVDLAWKRGRAEMSEMLEIVVIRLLDALEREPDFRYMLEQSAHFRELAQRRPDLIERLRLHLLSGRLEVVGGMASTLEVNSPHGECFIRNQQIGLKWVRETWGAEVSTGWLVDTFGLHAQIPQILRQFGIVQLMGSRFGGSHTHDLFVARGLDGSEITIAGWNTNAAYVRPENLSVSFCQNWDDVDKCFVRADALRGPGPFLAIPYTENEMLVSLRPLQIVRERNRDRQEQTWQMATPREYFAAVARSGRTLPVSGSDLNPEFTGCFSLRQPIRLRNRSVENRLLDAEKWAALAGLSDVTPILEDAWWQLAFVHFHDVFTGSHPTPVFHEVMRILDEVETCADRVLERAVSAVSTEDRDGSVAGRSFAVLNGLPYARRAIAEIPLPPGWDGVAHACDDDGYTLPFEVRDENIRLRVDLPAGGMQAIRLEAGAATPEETRATPSTTLENEFIRLDLTKDTGVVRLEWKPTGAVLLEDAGIFLVAQADRGNFQVEMPDGAEVGAELGEMRLERLPSPLGERARLSGAFPHLRWAGDGNALIWELEFTLLPERPEVDLRLRLHWTGESSRVRLRVPTTLDTSTGIYEIPFGVVYRQPYTPRINARGEWPAQRFVAIEDGEYGMALLNTGVAGVEVLGGTLLTTLLRAPHSVYAGMTPDETSSLHGDHEFHFVLAPYAGTWSDASIVARAQELNAPPLAFALEDGAWPEPREPFFSIDGPDAAHIVLSSIKPAQDGSGELIVRVYETTGSPAQAELFLRGTTSAWRSDLTEVRKEPAPVTEGRLSLQLTPFEIFTLRLTRD